MKIFAFTDIHGDKKAIKRIIKISKKEKPDLLLCAGDLSNLGTNLEKLLMMFKEVNIPLLIIPGNHETSDLVKKVCKKTKFAIPLHRAAFKVNNYIFFGYGEGGFERFDKTFESITKEFKKDISKDLKIILVTHAPPYKTSLDYLESTKSHHGNESIRKFVVSFSPILHICGHLHENENKVDKIKRTIIINPGKGKIIQF